MGGDASMDSAAIPMAVACHRKLPVSPIVGSWRASSRKALMDVSVEVMPHVWNSCSLPQLAERLLDLFLSANAVISGFDSGSSSSQHQQFFLCRCGDWPFATSC